MIAMSSFRFSHWGLAPHKFAPLLGAHLWMELTAMEHRGSARKGKEEFALSGRGKRLLAAAQVGRYADYSLH
jgi:hypothetical protein